MQISINENAKYIILSFTKSTLVFTLAFSILFYRKEAISDDLRFIYTIKELNNPVLIQMYFEDLWSYQSHFYIFIVCILILYATHLFHRSMIQKSPITTIKLIVLFFFILFCVLELPIYKSDCWRYHSFWEMRNSHFH